VAAVPRQVSSQRRQSEFSSYRRGELDLARRTAKAVESDDPGRAP